MESFIKKNVMMDKKNKNDEKNKKKEDLKF